MAALFLAMACKLPAAPPSDHHSDGGDSDTPTEVDADHDGYNASVDCNDADASIHPGAKETCGNGQDDNCSGSGDGCPWEGENTLEGWEISGSEPDERFGSTLAVCDADGDGHQDLVVGSAGTNEDAGAVHVFYGPLGEETEAARVWTILGTGPSTTLGSALDCQSDVTGDGAADLLIGEPDETAKSAGAMYVVPGGSTGVTPIADAYVSAWTGTYQGDRTGYGVVAIDVDGDDEDEVAVATLGQDGYDWELGVTHVVTAFPGTHPIFVWDDFVVGTVDLSLRGAVGNAGDLNGDGVDELALSARAPLSLADSVLLYQQGVSGALAADDWDAAIGSPGGSLLARFAQLGHADLNGDGYDDFLLGSPGDNSDAGIVLVYYGVLSGSTNDPDVELTGRDDSFTGKSIASPGDLDGDGNDELLIGAPGEGAVYLYGGGESGRSELDDAAQAAWRKSDSDPGAALAAGDLMGNAAVEFVIGVPHASSDNDGAVVLLPSVDL